MATYGELVTNIENWLTRPDLTTTEIPLAIKRAIKFYEGQRFWFNEAEDFFLTTEGVRSYSISNSHAQILQVLLTESGYRRELKPTDINELRRRDDDTTTKSRPYLWAYFNNRIEVYPPPTSTTCSVSYTYIIKAATLSASTDTNVWTLNAEDLIEARALWHLAGFKLQGNARTILLEQTKTMEAEALRRLRSETTRKTTAGKIRPTSRLGAGRSSPEGDDFSL